MSVLMPAGSSDTRHWDWSCRGRCAQSSPRGGNTAGETSLAKWWVGLAGQSWQRFACREGARRRRGRAMRRTFEATDMMSPIYRLAARRNCRDGRAEAARGIWREYGLSRGHTLGEEERKIRRRHRGGRRWEEQGGGRWWSGGAVLRRESLAWRLEFACQASPIDLAVAVAVAVAAGRCCPLDLLLTSSNDIRVDFI